MNAGKIDKCQWCGKKRYLLYSCFQENISYFFERKEREVDGDFCFGCTAYLFLDCTIKTLFLTWFGIIGATIGPFYIINNIYHFIKNSSIFILNKIGL